MRLLCIVLLAGCPKSAPVPAAPAEPPPPAEHSFTFAWPDGAWGHLVREHRQNGVTLRSELDVGVSIEGGAVQVRENLRLQGYEPVESGLSSALLLAAWEQRLPWTWILDESGRRVEQADRREAAKPFYDPSDLTEPMADELWFDAPDALVESQVKALQGVVPGHEDFLAVSESLQEAWGVGLPMLHGRNLRQGEAVTDEDAAGRRFTWLLGPDVPCGLKLKDTCATVEVTMDQDGGSAHRWAWTVDPTTLLPWAMSGDDGAVEFTEVWSWTVR